ncbi:hypothetical protein ABBQ38_001084 [Trebouxia sp. C0009 RCD-2024]
MESHYYLGFVSSCHHNMSFWTSFLVTAAENAMFAMQQQYAGLGIMDHALQCKLFDTLVLPTRYAVEIHPRRQILRHHHRTHGLNGTTGHPGGARGFAFSNQAVLAEGGSWPEWHEHVMLFLNETTAVSF